MQELNVCTVLYSTSYQFNQLPVLIEHFLLQILIFTNILTPAGAGTKLFTMDVEEATALLVFLQIFQTLMEIFSFADC